MQNTFGQEPPGDSMDVSSLVKDLMRRVRVLEERYSSIRKNIQVNERNMLDINKRLTTEIRTMSLDIGEIKQHMHDLKEEIQLIIRELKLSVRKDELKTLEKYIKLWDPMEFVTRSEIERFVRNERFIKQKG